MVPCNRCRAGNRSAHPLSCPQPQRPQPRPVSASFALRLLGTGHGRCVGSRPKTCDSLCRGRSQLWGSDSYEPTVLGKKCCCRKLQWCRDVAVTRPSSMSCASALHVIIVACWKMGQTAHEVSGSGHFQSRSSRLRYFGVVVHQNTIPLSASAHSCEQALLHKLL